MSREMQGMAPRTSQITLQELQTTQQQQIQNQHHQNPQMQLQNSSHFDQSTQDDFIDQMLSNLPSWPELPQNPKSPWELNPPPNPNSSNHQKLFKATRDLSEDPSAASQQENLHYFDESTMLASRLRQHQISENSPKSMMLQQQLLLSRGGGMDNRSSSSGSPAGAAACFGGGNSGFFPLPLTLGSGDSSDSSHIPSGDGSVQGLFNGLTGSIARPGPAPNQQHFHHSQTQNFNAPATGMNQAPPPVGSTGGGGATAPVRQKVRARRGQATDPHSIAERLRRERIAERMKALQELVPNANKTDKASMLDEIIDYVKFLQLQVKVLSMSRLGGAAAVAPLVADMSSEGGGDCVQQASGGLGGRNSNGTQTASPNDNNLTVTEHQVAKLMEEDMGSAMQYLQGKGLCLMPISLASAISTATCHSRNPTHPLLNPEGPSSPNLSVLTVQSATMINGGGESSAKDATSVSKP